MAWLCDRRVRFKATTQPFRPTNFPHLSIKFNLFFLTKVSNHLINQDSGTGPQRLPFLSSESNTDAAAHVIVRERLSYDDVQEAVGKAIDIGDRLGRHERNQAIKLAWKEVHKAIKQTRTLPKHVELNVDLKIRIRYSYMYVVGSSDYHGMVPSADLAFRLLEKCVGAATEKCCCSICLEEIGGAVALRMPCTHVFHGGCIEDWLRTSHYCPLCRYEMPTK